MEFDPDHNELGECTLGFWLQYPAAAQIDRRKMKKIEWWWVCEFILWKCQVQTNNASKVANHVLITELILCIIICMCPQCT
jgi:hypothetical protein